MKLSIITINYNNVEGLRRTIDSVLCQTWRDFEWIFIDGGSTDGSKELIEKTAAECPNVSYWCSEPDKGVYNAQNKGIAHAQGEYLNFMNSGDTFYDENVLMNVSCELRGEDICCGDTLCDDGLRMDSPYEISGEFFFQKRTLCHQSCFIRTHLQKKFPYDEKYKIVADRKFLIHVFLLNNSSYKKINHIVSIYDTKGYSSDINKLEVELEIMFHDVFSKRLLELIYDYIYGNNIEEKFFVELRTSKYRRFIYSVLVSIFKLLSAFKKNRESWVSDFPVIP